MQAIKNRDGEKIAEFVHPVKGVRFTPYTYVSLERDLVFSREAMKNFFADTDLYLWGYYDGIGSEIQLTPAEYYEEFIYSADFINAPEVGYNEVLSSGNMLENQFDVYDILLLLSIISLVLILNTTGWIGAASAWSLRNTKATGN